MLETALVALDLSPAEAPIVGCLADLRQWGIKKLILTHVVRVGYAQSGGYGHEPDLLAWLEKRAEPLRAEGLAVEVHVRSAGRTADELLAAAADNSADLVVIGSRSESRVKSLFLGSVARAVIHQTRLPLLLQWIEPTPEAAAETCAAVCTDMLGHILFATDFSRHAAHAQAMVAHLAPKARSTTLLHVMPTQVLEATPLWPVMAKAALDDIGARLEASGAKVDKILAQGEPAPTIASIAAEQHPSLVILGKHGQGWMQSLLIGSTAQAVCETARRPVLMVPLTAGKAEDRLT